MNKRKVAGNDGFTGSNTYPPPLKLVNKNQKNEAKEYSNEINSLKNELTYLKEMLLANLENANAGNENVEVIRLDIEKLAQQINDIDKKVIILEERTKYLDKIPNKDEMQKLLYEANKEIMEKIDEKLKDKPNDDKTHRLIDDVLTAKKIANETHVEVQVTKARNTQIIWTVSTLALATAILGLIIRLSI